MDMLKNCFSLPSGKFLSSVVFLLHFLHYSTTHKLAFIVKYSHEAKKILKSLFLTVTNVLAQSCFFTWLSINYRCSIHCTDRNKKQKQKYALVEK